MATELLRVQDIAAEVQEKNLLEHINLVINEGEIHVLMGPNGAGKSTLGNVIMGHPSYHISHGSVRFLGEDITKMTPDKRARKGLFLSFQNPEEVPGVSLENFLRTAKSAIKGEEENVFVFNLALKKLMKTLDMDPSYADRQLNVGFSGGEKKKSEILQMLALEPRLAILDETDSGLDIDAVRIVSQGIKAFHNKSNALLIITHNTKILENITPDFVHILVKGRLVAQGDASLIRTIEQKGYAPFFETQEMLS